MTRLQRVSPPSRVSFETSGALYPAMDASRRTSGQMKASINNSVNTSLYHALEGWPSTPSIEIVALILDDIGLLCIDAAGSGKFVPFR